MAMIEVHTPSDAGFALLAAHRNGNITLSKRAAQFAGQLVANDAPLSDAQNDWLSKLMSAAGLPPIGGEK